jgi:hypothetical protein
LKGGDTVPLLDDDPRPFWKKLEIRTLAYLSIALAVNGHAISSTVLLSFLGAFGSWGMSEGFRYVEAARAIAQCYADHIVKENYDSFVGEGAPEDAPSDFPCGRVMTIGICEITGPFSRSPSRFENSRDPT